MGGLADVNVCRILEMGRSERQKDPVASAAHRVDRPLSRVGRHMFHHLEGRNQVPGAFNVFGRSDGQTGGDIGVGRFDRVL